MRALHDDGSALSNIVLCGKGHPKSVMGEFIKHYDWLSVFYTHSLPVDVNDLSMVVRASKKKGSVLGLALLTCRLYFGNALRPRVAP